MTSAGWRCDTDRQRDGARAEPPRRLSRRLLALALAGAIGAAAVGGLPSGGLPEAAAQTKPPELKCNSSADWQLIWEATNVAPAPIYVPFPGIAGQTVSFQFVVRGPVWWQDHIASQLYATNGNVMTPDFEGRYVLPATGTYSIGVYGFATVSTSDSVAIPQHTAMPFTVSLRCS